MGINHHIPGRSLFLVGSLVKCFKSPENVSIPPVIPPLGINLRRYSISEEHKYLLYIDKHVHCKIYFLKLSYEFAESYYTTSSITF